MRTPSLLLVTASVVLPAKAADVYRTYINARFGTVVQYPANLVTPQPEADNGDGRRFISKDKQIELTVYASNNALGRTVKGEMGRAAADWKHDGGHLTYYKYNLGKANSGWYAISGYIGGDIFYEKALYKNGVFHTLIWQYPKSMKSRLDGVVDKTVRSFGIGTQTIVAGPATTATPAPSGTTAGY